MTMFRDFSKNYSNDIHNNHFMFLMLFAIERRCYNCFLLSHQGVQELIDGVKSPQLLNTFCRIFI